MDPTRLPPGATPRPPELSERLSAALAAKGPAYRPRTHHLEAGSPKFVNRLLLETSPYLLQHAHNPVDWHPWGKEAFELARKLGRPVLLSVGYATCHWCHVMERESFEDEPIARAMNERYVCIKVDREERPDIDAIYMAAVQAIMQGGGGWPMTVWLDAEQRPFFAGTYFPARDGERGARRGFLSLLGELADLYQRDPERVRQAAESLTEAVRGDLAPGEANGVALPAGRLVGEVVAYFGKAFDPVYGGLRRAPKFPSNLPLRLLLRHHRRSGDARALEMVTRTLERMAAGGIYDQLGGGFHRYSTDEQWLVPHFEKMLYDNALLAVAYAEAWQVTKRPDFARVLRETLDYLLREMTSPEGAFYSATDADSEGEEGLFFVWSEKEIRELLGPEAERFIKHYGVTPGGNFEGHTILNVERPDEAEWAALASARAKLYAAREKREHPLLDDKVLAAWNGLAVSACAWAGRVLREPRYLEAGRRAAAFCLERMREGGRLMRSFKDGRARHNGYLDDYAFLAQGLLDLHESTLEPRWLEEALALCEEVEAHFADKARGGWFLTRDDHEALLAREKPNYDGAEPSGTSVQLMNVLRLHELTGDGRWREAADRALAAFAPALAERPLGLTEMLLALDFARGPVREVVLTWPKGGSPAAFLEVLADTFLPHRVVTGAEAGPPLEALAARVALLEGRVAQGGAPTAYVCEHGACQLPATDPAAFAAQLKAPAG